MSKVTVYEFKHKKDNFIKKVYVAEGIHPSIFTEGIPLDVINAHPKFNKIGQSNIYDVPTIRKTEFDERATEIINDIAILTDTELQLKYRQKVANL